ncbi:MAG: sigma-70 family RNA polymerase sigma factor [Acidimicrobiales bacterium]|nr:sigma-70 family RNA polymerase sigma factor [Acidimicrobiales bacterium]
MTIPDTTDEVAAFELFVAEVEPRLRRALVSRYGHHDGRDAVAAALAWGWEHWSEVRAMDNLAGYLYRVACSRMRGRKVRVVFDGPDGSGMPDVEPALTAALARLSEHQRVAVVLTVAFDWTLAEVASLTGASVSTVNTHRRRGLTRLRNDLGVDLGKGLA